MCNMMQYQFDLCLQDGWAMDMLVIIADTPANAWRQAVDYIKANVAPNKQRATIELIRQNPPEVYALTEPIRFDYYE